ncbi:hypothetical protein CR513_12154, partial [Mucuna pruriens]
MLLLQEFDIEIRDKSGVENLVVNHLSRIEGRIDPLPIKDDFPDEQLMQLDGVYQTMRSIQTLVVSFCIGRRALWITLDS